MKISKNIRCSLSLHIEEEKRAADRNRVWYVRNGCPYNTKRERFDPYAAL